jgi:hypothetical protein
VSSVVCKFGKIAFLPGAVLMIEDSIDYALAAVIIVEAAHWPGATAYLAK